MRGSGLEVKEGWSHSHHPIGKQRQHDSQQARTWSSKHEEEHIREIEENRGRDSHRKPGSRCSTNRGESWLLTRYPLSRRGFCFNLEMHAAEWEDGKLLINTVKARVWSYYLQRNGID